MIYECDVCSAALPPCALACPQCGEVFDEAVPEDAVFPPGLPLVPEGVPSVSSNDALIPAQPQIRTRAFVRPFFVGVWQKLAWTTPLKRGITACLVLVCAGIGLLSVYLSAAARREKPHSASVPRSLVAAATPRNAPAEASLRIVSTLPEAQRKQIYYEIGRIEDKATHQADLIYPITSGDSTPAANSGSTGTGTLPQAIELNRKMNQDLTERYDAQLRQRYHLTDAMFSGILLEGIEKHWPAPDAAKI